MLISHAYRFSLLMPWKTASSTCRQTLRKYDESPYQQFFAFNPYLNRVVTQHLTLAEFLALPEGRLDYRIAAFVRNPYDRAYSAFIQIQRDFENQPKFHFAESWIGDLVRAQIAENMSRVISAGFDFDRWLGALPEYEICEVGRNSNMKLHPAHYWTHVCGVQRAGFVGKVETFKTDFGNFCTYVGIDAPEIINSNVSQFGESNEPILGSKYAAKMSHRSLDRINELFCDDFELFQYERISTSKVGSFRSPGAELRRHG